MKVKPLGDRVLIQALEAKGKPRVVYYSDTAKERRGRQNYAVTKVKRTMRETVPLSVKVGDVVLYGKYSSTEITIDGEEYPVVREDDIVAVVG